jgi:hypothetical protein
MKVALTGYAGVGKGLVAEIIQELGLQAGAGELVKGSFAYPIKEFLRRLCNMTDQHLYGELKEIPLTFTITPDSFNAAAAFYLEYGLDDYVSFDRMWGRFTDIMAAHMTGLGEESNWSLHSISSRRLQQLLGTEVVRHFRNSTWVDVALAHEFNIIDDLRFLNEAELLSKNGYTIIRIVGKETRIEDAEAKAHASEREIPLIKADITLDNKFDTYDSASKRELKARLIVLLVNSDIL